MENNYCLEECAQWVLSNKFSKVGLEFTSNTEIAVRIALLLQEKIGFPPIILHDSTRACGNCCVDERTAKPRGIDAIIHFGTTCLTPTNALPVLYVIPSNVNFSSEDVCSLLKSTVGPQSIDDLILFYDVTLIHSISSIYEDLKRHFSNLVRSSLIIPNGSTLTFQNLKELENSSSGFPFLIRDESLPEYVKFGEIPPADSDEKSLVINNRNVVLPRSMDLTDYNFVYLGSNSATLTSLQMRFSDRTFYTVSVGDSETCCDVSGVVEPRLKVSNFVKVVMGRSKKIELVKEAKTVGLLFTLVKGYKEMIKHLKALVKISNKRCYTFYMGKINEAKLGNIVGVDVFVYIGCPESSFFDRVEEPYLYKHIVFPWEAEVALNPYYDWSLNFEVNFRELLHLEERENSQPEDCVEEESSSHLLQRNEDSAVVERNPGTLYKLHRDAAGEALVALSWQGLDPKKESLVPIGTVVEGKKGIAARYESEDAGNKV